MRTLALVTTAAALLGIAGFTTLVRADETTKAPEAPCVPQKALQNPLLETLVGSWTTESTSMHGDQEVKGAGKSTFAMGVGSTVLLQDYENTGPGMDGKPMTFHGHGVYKVSDDGKTIKAWWFDDMSPEPTVLSGPLTDKDYTISADTPMGKMTVSFQKTDAGVAFKMTMPGHEMKETYTRSGK